MPLPLSRRSILRCAAAGAIALAAPAVHGQKVKQRIKIAQIGTGHAHASKLGVYRASDEYEVVGICEPDEQERGRAEKSVVYKDLPWMTTEQLLNIPDLQAVLVETKVRDSLNAAALAIAAGKHVHLDKPAGESLPYYRQILKQAEEKKLLVQMGYMFRYNPAVVLMRKFIAAGWLGELFEVHTVMSKVVGGSERDNLAQYPGGIMFELGCHVIDLVVSTLGKPTTVRSVARHVAKREDQLLDNMLAVFEYQSAIASVKSSAVEVDGGSRRHFTVCGTSGSFHIQPLDAPNVRYTLERDQGEYKKGTHEIKIGGYPRYYGDAADMAAIIRGEKSSDYSYAHDLAVQEAVLLASGVRTS
ncbi:putative oxidoreductase YhhX [Anatilimnocola aggregata]|uniref:Putative oxidoreductase YhhX n=1 Tax=Anatilimnocola aggregata TaxID=2528021 RepID=A0A517YJE4_9BACT|nr:Gfo/Idh/MocA family oxidoreductase [Anatilimnocola aggregata]QDU30341.1 putative oxidoreductase YhhX [Anatilimnocola aggregata]